MSGSINISSHQVNPTLYSSSSLCAARFNLFPTDEKFKSRNSANSGSVDAESTCFLVFSPIIDTVGAEVDGCDGDWLGGGGGLRRLAGSSTWAYPS